MSSKLSSPPLASHRIQQPGENPIKQMLSTHNRLEECPGPSLNAVHGIMILKLPQSYQISLQEGPAYLGTVWKVIVTCYHLFFKNRPMAKDFAYVKF